MPEGSPAIAILLMLPLILAGLIITFNWIPMLGLGFNNITGISSGVWIIIVKLVGVALIAIPIWIIVGIIREGMY